MPRVCHFEINSDDVERASGFYRDVFGWKIEKWEGPFDYWTIKTGDGEMGIDGGMMKRPHPGASTVNTICVSSVDEYVQKITAKGGSVVMDKTPIPGVGYMAYCKDTEGNPFGLMEPDESAK
jgi:predicted enzyme related to lactoylglutathione lyase